MQAVDTVGVIFLKTVVLPALGILSVWAASHVPAWIATKVSNQRVASVIERLSQLAFTVVNEVQQTIVTRLTTDIGKPSPEQLAAARDQAIATLKSHLGPKGVLEIKTALGLSDESAVDKLIVSFIESAVLTLRQMEPKLV